MSKKYHLSKGRQVKFSKTVETADLVIAGNKYLQDFAITINPNTYIVPTSIDTNRYTVRPKHYSSEHIIIGWIGSNATLYYLERMKHVWDEIFDRFPFTKLKIISNSFFSCGRIPVIKKQWNYEDEIQDLHSLNIGLMPLIDDPWTRGKCGFKLLQYMASGIPSVSSPVGVNKEIIQDGVNGMLATEDAEWIEKITMLIKDANLRNSIAKSARKTVFENYSLDANSKELITLFNKLKQ